MLLCIVNAGGWAATSRHFISKSSPTEFPFCVPFRFLEENKKGKLH